MGFSMSPEPSQDVPASGDGAAQSQQLRAAHRRYTHPPEQNQPPELTWEWIKVGGKVNPYSDEARMTRDAQSARYASEQLGSA